MFIFHGLYRFRRKRVAFRNDYCLFCAQPRRSVQVRSFLAWHLFWIPVIPLGFHNRWLCTVCGRDPHVHPGTRRGFKWAGLVVLLIFSVGIWTVTLTPDDLIMGWVFRVGAPTGALLTLRHLLRTSGDPSLNEKLAAIPPASDTACPFCNSNLLVLSSESSCPTCGIFRA
jgi:hypothetical protein